ncbi:uncharacterized protein BXZ73DRAFT_91047 [Epithele typhae]|uniref:uncharacterized protein n=1 Tax=Epithele typhae TaxID=378194 RepID=UPI0020076668|nr:uncharacterized protein BXZ73DRAFT_91047 [Epithele typhae]KAH9925950.1 hypothetical protein BXZ73DRAFT_91047 [Epithele typhae]
MCELECFGNYHRGCEHYVKLYESGKKTDCGSPACALSAAHKHRPGQRSCAGTCITVPREGRRVLSLIHERCDSCTRAAWATLERESGRVY